jgi:amidase
MMTAIPIEAAGGAVPPELVDRFWLYDTALLTNDKATMNELFAPGPATLRGDGNGVLVGHEAISTFRSARSRRPTRKVVDLHVRMLSADLAVLMATTTEPIGGGFGLQTQVWRRHPSGQWHVEIAHVSAVVKPRTDSSPPPQQPSTGSPPEAAVWRVHEPITPDPPPGPLSGLRMAVKDLFAVAGYPIGAGVPAWLAEQAPQTVTAPAVQALLDAGAHLAGIAQTDEFAYSIAGVNAHYGSAANPVAPHATTGGSTSGPASAVAAGAADVGLGTDTAGSIRVPASYTGLVGLRTTHGRIPLTGVLGLAADFDTVGWLTRDIETALAVGEILFTQTDATPLQPSAILIVPALHSRLTPLVRAAFDIEIERLSTSGDLPPVRELHWTAEDLDVWFRSFRTWQAWQAWQQFGPWITAHPGALGADVAARFQTASGTSERAANDAHEVVQSARRRVRQQLGSGVLALPTTATSAPARSATPAQLDRLRDATLRLTSVASIAGAPAVSLPTLQVPESWLPNPSPVGLCLVGPPDFDMELLRLARRISPAAQHPHTDNPHRTEDPS